jgi:hypothetical protein
LTLEASCLESPTVLDISPFGCIGQDLKAFLNIPQLLNMDAMTLADLRRSGGDDD